MTGIFYAALAFFAVSGMIAGAFYLSKTFGTLMILGIFLYAVRIARGIIKDIELAEQQSEREGAE